MRTLTSADDETIETIAAHLRSARRVAFLTGAGLSAESGLPTYRGVGGLYNDIPVDEGLPIEEILSGEMFHRHPALTWKYLLEIERACRGAAPNNAHRFMAALEALCEVWVMTQNVDGFHTDAGSRQVIELHGRLRELVCTGCENRENAADFEGLRLPPRCAHCGAVLRPEVVLFGEALPARAVALYQRQWLLGFDLVFAVGTSAGFGYILDPVVAARRRGAVTVEINPDRTPLSDRVTHRVACGARVATAALAERLNLSLNHGQ